MVSTVDRFIEHLKHLKHRSETGGVNNVLNISSSLVNCANVGSGKILNSPV
jgi:hypothetical protein